MNIQQVEEVVTKALVEREFQQELVVDFEKAISDFELGQVEQDVLHHFSRRLVQKYGTNTWLVRQGDAQMAAEGWF